MPTEMLTKDDPRSSPESRAAVRGDSTQLRRAERRQVRRVRRLKMHVAACALGTSVLTTLWAVNQWQANGALERFGHEGEPGQWNPTLWALAVGIWILAVGIMALRVTLERPPTPTEIEREVERLGRHATAKGATSAELWRFALARRESLRRLSFHAAAWAWGMLVLTPLWALIEWQDNGAFERFSDASRPGEWEPWILYVGGIWALAVALIALRAYVERPTPEAAIDRIVNRLRHPRALGR